MPVATTYPGVYIQEEPSAVHTITGVPTSVAAFVGYSPRGPVNEAVHVTSWADYVRVFGALDPNQYGGMGYAVFLFFANGGSAAEVVRAGSSGNAAEKKATIKIADDFILEATSPGDWANDVYRASVLPDPEVGGANESASFGLTIEHKDPDSGQWQVVESYNHLTPARVQLALAQSSYFTFSGTTAPAAPQPPQAAPAPAAAGPAPAAPAPAPAPAAPTPIPATASGGKDTAQDITKLDIAGTTPGHGVYALDKVDIFNILCLPRPVDVDHSTDTLGNAVAYCEKKRAMLILDPPNGWGANANLDFQTVSNGMPVHSANAAVYVPNIHTTNTTTGLPEERGPSGALAGVWAATDVARGVWKAPAGTNAGMVGIAGLAAAIDDEGSGVLNPLGVNCVRTMPLAGPVVWGARTCRGADTLADQWKYLPVRRTALFIEESLRRGTQWIVFEPNDETLWAAIRLNVGAFMNSLFRQGAFQGSTPQEAYLVKCDKENNPQNDIDRGIVNILVGFAPLKPAEFVIIHIQQLAGQLQV